MSRYGSSSSSSGCIPLLIELTLMFFGVVFLFQSCTGQNNVSKPDSPLTDEISFSGEIRGFGQLSVQTVHDGRLSEAKKMNVEEIINLLNEFDGINSIEFNDDNNDITVNFIEEVISEETENPEITPTDSFYDSYEEPFVIFKILSCTYSQEKKNSWVIVTACRWG